MNDRALREEKERKKRSRAPSDFRSLLMRNCAPEQPNCVCLGQTRFLCLLRSCCVQTVGEPTPQLCFPLDTQLSACPVSLLRLNTKGAPPACSRACVRARHRRFSCSVALIDTHHTKARWSRIRRGQGADETLMSARATRHRY